MTSLPNVTVTPAAEKFMRRMVRFAGLGAGAGFRLVVSAGGCSGLNSEFSIEAAPQPSDATLDVNGMAMFLPAESRLLLEGVTIDFADTIASSGLKFIKPNAPACASCGSSSAPGAGLVSFDIASIKRG